MDKGNWKDVEEVLRYLAETYPFDKKDPFEPKVIPLNARTPDGDTPLHFACHWGDLKAISLLVHAGAPVNEKGDMGCTPLEEAVSKNNVEAAKLLLSLGASPHITNEFGSSAYKKAMTNGSSEMKEAFSSHAT